MSLASLMIHTVKGIAALATWPVRCLGLYLVWCFRVAVHGILLVSGEDLERTDD